MKCVCGYEHEEAYRTNDGVEIGDEKFIYVDFGRYPTIQNKHNYRDESVDIYACPKCGTLKIDI